MILLVFIMLTCSVAAGPISPANYPGIEPSWFAIKQVVYSNYGYFGSIGGTCYTTVGYTVPEPSIVVLLLIGIAALYRRKK